MVCLYLILDMPHTSGTTRAPGVKSALSDFRPMRPGAGKSAEEVRIFSLCESREGAGQRTQ